MSTPLRLSRWACNAVLTVEVASELFLAEAAVDAVASADRDGVHAPGTPAGNSWKKDRPV